MAYVAAMGSSLQSTPDSIIYGTPEEVFNFAGGHNIHDFFYPRSRPPFTGIIIDKVEILFGMSRTCECFSIFLCPRFKVSSVLPSLQLKLSDEKVKMLMQV